MSTALVSRIKLGQKLRDKITRVTGTCSAIQIELNGNIRVNIQAKANRIDGKVPEPIVIDEIMAEVIGEGVSDTIPAPRLCNFEVGNEVKDRINGIEGVVVGVAWFTTGCVYLNVQHKGVTRDGKPIAGYSPQEKWEKTGEHAIKDVALAPKVGAPPGGPMEVGTSWRD